MLRFCDSKLVILNSKCTASRTIVPFFCLQYVDSQPPTCSPPSPHPHRHPSSVKFHNYAMLIDAQLSDSCPTENLQPATQEKSHHTTVYLSLHQTDFAVYFQAAGGVLNMRNSTFDGPGGWRGPSVAITFVGLMEFAACGTECAVRTCVLY